MLDVSKITTTIGEFQRNYLFHLSVPTLPPGLDNDYDTNNLDLVVNMAPIPEAKTRGGGNDVGSLNNAT